LESIEKEQTGDGAIIAPRYMPKEKVLSLSLSFRQKCFFDPQYYLPNSSSGKLSTYEFFPQVIADGFRTTEWTPELAYRSAYECLSFQISCDFRYLVTPTRFREGMPSDYIESQAVLFVDPFINAYMELGRPKPLLLQIILTDQMLKDRNYITEILNWVTGIQTIEGIYLIYQHNRTRKQIEDIELLLSVDYFIKSIKNSGMIVVIGYMNTESIPLMCAEPDIITIGSYENMRIFNTLSFEDQTAEDNKRRGPNARIYIDKLLQWVEHNYLGAINRVVPNLEEFVVDNAHRVAMFEPSYKWYFSKPDPYLHYFASFSDQFRRLSTHEGVKRVQLVKRECQSALDQYKGLEEGGVVFDPDSGGRHLTSWLTFLNQR
jgi:hypothetical protein